MAAGPASPAAVEVSVESLAERFTTADLDALIAALSDEALAYLVLAGARQLRRRLVRTGTNPGGRPVRTTKSRGASALERAVRQLAAELGGAGEIEDA